jgi:hypothetical protein
LEQELGVGKYDHALFEKASLLQPSPGPMMNFLAYCRRKLRQMNGLSVETTLEQETKFGKQLKW